MPVQRRLCDEDVAALDQLLHVAEEECQQQRADVAAVDVGVGHDDDLAVADLRGIKIVFGDAGAERRDDGADFLVAQHLVVAGLFDVQNFTLQAGGWPGTAVAALLGGAAGGFALDQEQLAALGIRSGSRPACPAGRRNRARPCGGSGRGPCGRLRVRAPHRSPC